MIENQPKTIVGIALRRDIKDARPLGATFKSRDCDSTDSCAESCSTDSGGGASCSSATCSSAKDRK